MDVVPFNGSESIPQYDEDRHQEYGLPAFSIEQLELWEPYSPLPSNPAAPSAPCPQPLTFSLNVYENGAACTYSSEAKMIFVTMDTPIHITFDIDRSAVPDGTSMVAMVWYRDEQHRQERGPVARCPKHLAGHSQCVDFMTCHHPASKSGTADHHQYIAVPLQSLQWSPEGYHCSYSYHCMTSCFGGGKRKTELVTIFSLCLNEQELGRETMITRVCSSPLRDRRKVLGNVDPQKRPRLSTSPTPPPPPPTYSHLPNLSSEPHPMLETDGTPDKDGYYSFTWKVKDKGVFNMLQLMKAGYEVSHPPS
eukprot:Em0016g298a